MIQLDQGASDGRTHQARETNNTENHAHPDSGLIEIGGQARDGGGEQALDARGEESIDETEDQQSRPVVYGGPAEEHDGGKEDKGDESVEWTQVTVSAEIVRDQTADDPDAVHDQQDVDGPVVAELEDVVAEGTDLFVFIS